MTNKFKLGLLIIACSMFFVQIANGYTILDLQIPEIIKVPESDTQLQIQGAGVREKFFVKVYVGAFYASEPTKTRIAALNSEKPRRMYFQITHRKISKEKFRKAWEESIRVNNSTAFLFQNNSDINTFLNYFDRAFRKGDEITIDYIPEVGTKVAVNGEVKGIIEGKDFFTVVLSTWMGDNPPSVKFRNALLGS